MEQPLNAPNLMQWFQTHKLENVQPITKHSAETSAWFATISERDCFLKFYPHELAEPCAAIEMAIAGANLHPAIVPLHQSVQCHEGTLLLYDRVRGENLGSMENRGRFQALPLAERIMAVVTIFAALTSICDAGFMIMDWYEGNMIYDFSQRRIWLFDWDLCRKGDSFTLEMDSNYGSSRLMAPEEFIRGSRLDQRTLVFNLGRYALLTLPELAETLAPILARATYPAPAGRYRSLRKFTQAFVNAAPQAGGLCNR